MNRRQASDLLAEWGGRAIAEYPVEEVTDAAQPGGVHPCGRPSPWVLGVGRVDAVGQVGYFEAAPGAVANFPDLFVGSGVVVAGADEPASVFVVKGNLVGLCDEPSKDMAGFAELVAEVGRHSRRRSGAFRRSSGFG